MMRRESGERVLTAREKVEGALETLGTVRDDVRVRAHLAGLEAKQAFLELDVTLHGALAGRRPDVALIESLTQKLHELDAKTCARIAKARKN